jgi:UDP-glucose 6-dehydrogenase
LLDEVGAGYVGLTVGAGLASLGHTVVIVDRMLDRVDAINEGRSRLFEVGSTRRSPTHRQPSS